jgi:hypothetical protein
MNYKPHPGTPNQGHISRRQDAKPITATRTRNWATMNRTGTHARCYPRSWSCPLSHAASSAQSHPPYMAATAADPHQFNAMTANSVCSGQRLIPIFAHGFVSHRSHFFLVLCCAPVQGNNQQHNQPNATRTHTVCEMAKVSQGRSGARTPDHPDPDQTRPGTPPTRTRTRDPPRTPGLSFPVLPPSDCPPGSRGSSAAATSCATATLECKALRALQTRDPVGTEDAGWGTPPTVISSTDE